MPIEREIRLHQSTTDTEAYDNAPDAHTVEIPAARKPLIRLANLFALLCVSKPTGHRLIAAGKIGPSAIRLTSACVRYDADEVDAWLSMRKADGNLHDARSWAPVWETIKRKRN